MLIYPFFRSHGFLFLVGLFLVVFSPHQNAESRVLNLSGSLELIYSRSWTEQNKKESQTETLQKRFNLANVGDIWDPRLGSYHFNGTFLDFKGYGDGTDSNLRIMDFYLSANLLPRLYPLTVFAQRVESDNKSSVIIKDTRTTYGLNWVLPIRNFPTLRLNLQQTQLDSDFSPDTSTRYVNLTGDGKYRNLSLRAGVQYTDVEVEGGASNESYSLNLNMDGPLDITETLTMNAFATYANRGGTSVGGVGSFQERGVGLSFFHRPSLTFNQNTSYSFFDTPANVSFQRHIFSYGLNWRPTGNVDMGGSYRLLRFEIDRVIVNSHFLSLHGSWRPLFGLNITPSITGGVTDTSGASQADTQFVRMSLGVNYTRSFLEVLRWTTGLSLGPGISWTEDGTTTRRWDLPLNFSSTINNLITRYVYLAMTYSYHLSRIEESISVSGKRTDLTQDHRIQLTGNSPYFKNLLFLSDRLFLDALVSYANRVGGIVAENTFFSNTQASYYLPKGITIKGGYSHRDFSGIPRRVSDSFLGELQWNTVIFRYFSIVSSVRNTWQLNQGSEDAETLSGNASLAYQLGRLSMNIRYTLYRIETGSSNSLTHTIYVRAVRPF